jgi:hypothetical protein
VFAEAISLHFLKHDSLCVRRATEGVRLPSGAQMRLLVVVVAPPLVLAVVLVLSGRLQTTWFACAHTKHLYIFESRINTPACSNIRIVYLHKFDQKGSSGARPKQIRCVARPIQNFYIHVVESIEPAAGIGLMDLSGALMCFARCC